jgi:hypothetical protein
LSFSKDGRYLIGAVKRKHTVESDIHIWKITPTTLSTPTHAHHPHSIQGNEKLQLVTAQFNQVLNLENVLSLQAVSSNYFAIVTSIADYSFENNNNSFGSNEESITGSNKEESHKGMLNYQLKVYKFVNALTNELILLPQLVQVINFHLPEFKSKLGFTSSSLKNAALEVAMTVEPKHGQYLVISCR